MIEHKGYLAQVEFDDDTNMFHGEVINIRDVITFQGKSVAEMKLEFEKSIAIYLDFCHRHGKVPDSPVSSKLELQLPPLLHFKATVARVGQKNLNEWGGV